MKAGTSPSIRGIRRSNRTEDEDWAAFPSPLVERAPGAGKGEYGGAEGDLPKRVSHGFIGFRSKTVHDATERDLGLFEQVFGTGECSYFAAVQEHQ
jgi:hypothetical protein